jgi:protease-4
MDKNRKIVMSILALMVLTAVLAIIDISMNLKDTRREGYSISAPKTGPGVGIVRISGTIEIADRGESLFMNTGAESVIRRLDELEKNSNIKAIVVRINSPGGTVGATQEIFAKLMKVRKKNIILVASLGDVAASGGYYAASACNHIVANPGTLTGSIGVIAATPNLRGLFDKLGIRMNVIKSGKYKDILSSFKDMTPEERALLQDMIDTTYSKFLKDVALGRNMPISDIQPWADGRIMTGESALSRKLIDETGSFETAIERAKEKAKLPEDAPVYEDIKSPIEQLFMSVENAMGRGTDLEKRVGIGRYNIIEYRYLP